MEREHAEAAAGKSAPTEPKQQHETAGASTMERSPSSETQQAPRPETECSGDVAAAARGPSLAWPVQEMMSGELTAVGVETERDGAVVVAPAREQSPASTVQEMARGGSTAPGPETERDDEVCRAGDQGTIAAWPVQEMARGRSTMAVRPERATPRVW